MTNNPYLPERNCYHDHIYLTMTGIQYGNMHSDEGPPSYPLSCTIVYDRYSVDNQKILIHCTDKAICRAGRLCGSKLTMRFALPFSCPYVSIEIRGGQDDSTTRNALSEKGRKQRLNSFQRGAEKYFIGLSTHCTKRSIQSLCV